MTMLLYSLALTLGLTVASPWWLTRMLTTQRYREGLRQRLGSVPAALRAAASGKQIIWLHAVSVGEVLAATRLVAELEETLGVQHPQQAWRVVVSTTTRTSQALARERFGAGRVFYLPLDFAFAVRTYLRALQPRALILMESELWPRLLHECAARNIPVAVANARVSDRSFGRSMKLRSLWQRMAKHVSLFLAQSDQDAERLITLGAAKEHVKPIGNLKFDTLPPKPTRIAELIQDLAGDRPVIVAGSTVASAEAKVADEEAQVIYGWMKGAQPSDAVLVLAPRHPERFAKVWDMIFDFPSLKATEMLAGKRAKDASCRNLAAGESLTSADIVLLDTVGDLADVYRIADIAYVGGSMMERGGHNPLEPAQFAVPVVMGSSYENFREIVGELITHGAIAIVKDEAELDLKFEELLKDRGAAVALGQRGFEVFSSQHGAISRSVKAISEMVQP